MVLVFPQFACKELIGVCVFFFHRQTGDKYSRFACAKRIPGCPVLNLSPRFPGDSRRGVCVGGCLCVHVQIVSWMCVCTGLKIQNIDEKIIFNTPFAIH